jgi:hypothetical protein
MKPKTFSRVLDLSKNLIMHFDNPRAQLTSPRQSAAGTILQSAREETISLTEDAVRVEKEIDERVKNLYGL